MSPVCKSQQDEDKETKTQRQKYTKTQRQKYTKTKTNMLAGRAKTPPLHTCHPPLQLLSSISNIDTGKDTKTQRLKDKDARRVRTPPHHTCHLPSQFLSTISSTHRHRQRHKDTKTQRRKDKNTQRQKYTKTKTNTLAGSRPLLTTPVTLPHSSCLPYLT